MLTSKEQHWRSPAKKLEEEITTDYEADRKNPRYGNTKTYFNKPSEWLKRMIVED